MHAARPDRVPSFVTSLCEDLPRRVLEIVDEWAALVETRARHGLPSGVLAEEAPSELTGAVLEAALCAPNDSVAYGQSIRRVVRLAARHGALCRNRGLERDALFMEYDLLREAVWRYVRPLARMESASAIVRVDDTLSIATRASLQGYHRPELEANGRWASAMEALVAEALSRGRPGEEPKR